METSRADTGLVEDDDLRFEHERARYRDALALSAGKFVRIAVLVFDPQADQREEPSRFRATNRGDPIPCSRMGSAIFDAHGHARVERREASWKTI